MEDAWECLDSHIDLEDVEEAIQRHLRMARRIDKQSFAEVRALLETLQTYARRMEDVCWGGALDHPYLVSDINRKLGLNYREDLLKWRALHRTGARLDIRDMIRFLREKCGLLESQEVQQGKPQQQASNGGGAKPQPQGQAASGKPQQPRQEQEPGSRRGQGQKVGALKNSNQQAKI